MAVQELLLPAAHLSKCSGRAAHRLCLALCAQSGAASASARSINLLFLLLLQVLVLLLILQDATGRWVLAACTRTSVQGPLLGRRASGWQQRWRRRRCRQGAAQGF